MAEADMASAPVNVSPAAEPVISREVPSAAPVHGATEEPRSQKTTAENSSIWCSAVGRRLPRAQCENYAEQIADLRSGVAAFNPNRSMVKGVPTEVRLAIGPEEEKERTVERAGGEGEAQTAEIEIGAKMRARLKGRAFEIDPAEPVDQVMGRNRRQVWNWDVTPRRDGSHQLSAEITVLAEDGTVLENQSSKVINVTVVVSEAERAALERERLLKKRQILEEDVGWITRFLKILDDFSLALLAFLTTIIVGVITLFVRAKKAKQAEAKGDQQEGNGVSPADPE
ncbi:hypothetical protein [Sphingorhabdus sp. M41]|uniref:hypothetical protein n=1 Tax=Sphingorhabdus sp. M41 TaxID=1806885 RepID=UPI001E52C6C7|nr:hypothetical protein [Sphingorhabdus sp. M41]